MIAENHQKDILYFKQYPCYSITTHLSEHRQRQFANVSLVQFSKRTNPMVQLPKYLIDKFQVPQQMYWLEWRIQEQQNLSSAQNKLILNTNSIQQSRESNKFRCLYIAELGKMAHVKLVFNYDPQFIAICRDYLYTLGGNQLIITQLWPQNVPSMININSSTQLPPKQNQIVHKLDNQSKVLSLDFIYSQIHQAQCKIIYFNQKKGIYAQTFNNSYTSGQNSIINKILDLPSIFKKNESAPLFYKTIVPNILGIQILNKNQFILVNLTQMKVIQSTRTKFDSWSLNQNHSIIIKSFKNTPNLDFNDCISISIGQGSNIQIFLYHIKFIQTATLISPLDQTKKKASDIKLPINHFTSAQFIDFQSSVLKQFSIINLQRITHLKNYILSAKGVIYLGYNKNALQMGQSDQLPLSGFVYYNTPYITHQILMQQNKIWREYKIDLLLHKCQIQNQTNNFQNNLYRLLIPGRYQKWFIMKYLQINKITDLNKKILQDKISFSQINKILAFEWRKQYEFVQFVIFKQQILIIRKNSIGAIVSISQQEFVLQNDKFSQQQINYNQLQSKNFTARYDFQGDEYIDEQFNANQHKYQSNSQSSKYNIFKGCRTYEQKIKFINAYLQNYTQSTWFQNGIQGQKSIAPKGYYDAQQVKKYSQIYKKTLDTILYLSQLQCLQKLPQNVSQNNLQFRQNNNFEQTKLLLHLQILCLKLKNKLSFYLISLKSYYHYYFEHLMQIANNQYKLRRQMQQQGNGIVNNKNMITTQMLQKIHFRHIYIVFILQWIVNIGQKSSLQKQYQYFNQDLIDQFIYQYVKKYNSKTNSSSQSSSINKKIHPHNHLYKQDIPIHINNIISLLLKGLISQTKIQTKQFNLSQIIDQQSLPQQNLIQNYIYQINSKSNLFILMLLKKNNLIKSESNFITNNLLNSLYKPLVLQPFNPNLVSYVNVNKTFVYSILNLSLRRQEKLNVLSANLDSKQYLALLLLIQLENNCHWIKQQDGLIPIFAKKGEQDFQKNTLILTRQNCCIIQELILMNYKLFLFPSKSDSIDIKKNTIKEGKFISNISSLQYLDEKTKTKQKKSIQFIKTLFSQIDFKYLSSYLSKIQRKKLHSSHKDYINQDQNTIYDNKNIYQIHRQLLKQVQQINQQFSCNKQSKIQKTFSKYYKKIYKRQSQDRNRSNTGIKKDLKNIQTNYYQSSQIYPQMTGEGYGLSKWQLQKIDKLYKRFLQSLRNQSKHHYSIDTIHKRQNLQYSMIKIYLFRLKCALEQIQYLVEIDKKQYADIINEIVQRLEESLVSFKKCIQQLQYENIQYKNDNQQQNKITDQEVLEILKQTDRMQNYKIYDDDQQTGTDQQSIQMQINRNWSIINIPISLQWLRLFKLTFESNQQGKKNNGNKKLNIFTNYHSLESILLKILMQIKLQKLSNQQKCINKLFGQQKITQIINGNQQLKYLNHTNQIYKYNKINYKRQNIGLLSGQSFQ